MSSPSSSSETEVGNAHLLQEWRTFGALAFSFLGFIDALFTAKREHLATTIDALLTGAEATALVGVVCGAYLVWKYRETDVQPSNFAAALPVISCYVSGAFLLVVTCMGRWKTTCVAGGLLIVVLCAANAKAIGGRAIQRCIDIKRAIGATLALLVGTAREMRAIVGGPTTDVNGRVGHAEGGMAP